MSIFTASGQMPSLRKASAGKIPERVLHYKAMQNSAPPYFFAGVALSCTLGFTIKIWLLPTIIFLDVVLFFAWGYYFGRRGVREIQREYGLKKRYAGVLWGALRQTDPLMYNQSWNYVFFDHREKAANPKLTPRTPWPTDRAEQRSPS